MIQNEDEEGQRKSRNSGRFVSDIRLNKKALLEKKQKRTLEFMKNIKKFDELTKSRKFSKNKKSKVNTMESINSSNNELRHKSYSRKQGKNSQKRSSVSIKAQNYVKPEISYISKMPEYSTFKLPEKKKPDFEQNLPNIEEERATEAPSFSKPQKFERAQTIDEDYMGLFDILMKELSDVPGGIQEKVSKVTVETFKNDLIKITRRSNKKKIKLSFKEQISKLNVCTYNCDPDQIQFDLEKGSG